MALLNVLNLFLFSFFLRCHSSENQTNTPDITANCFKPLGISDGRIQDFQLISSSAFDNDFKMYGPQRARLNMTSWPPGYRSAPDKAYTGWIKVDFGYIMVITGIATQGYGDTTVNEWLKSYMLLYSQGAHYSFFRKINSGIQIFTGNQDSNSIQLNHVTLPTKALSVMIMPVSFENNFAFRMELYGCEPDYYFVTWLMLAKTPFTVNSLASRIDHERSRAMIADVQQQVTELLKATPGFLSTQVRHFSPQESDKHGTLLTAEVVIECLRGSQTNLVTKLKETVTSGKTIFNSKYSIEVQYTADEINLLTNVSLNLTKNLQEVKEILPDERYTIEANIPSLDRTVNSTLIEFDFKWEISTIDDDTGQFFPVVGLLDNERNITITPQQMSVGFTFVRVSVKPKVKSGPVSYDFGFIRILPRLTVTIDGPDVAVKGGGPIRLHSVIQGELQDSFGNKAANVTFVWSCTVENSESSNVSLALKPFSNNNQMNTTECFDPGILRSTREPSLVFNPDLLISKRTYIFQVLVSQGRRFVTASHKIRVDTNISLSVKCVTNCEHKVSTRRKVVFETQCRGTSCSALTNYRWCLFVLSDNGSNKSWSEIKNLDRIALTSLDGPNLVVGGEGIPRNHSSLLGNKTYKIQIIAQLDKVNFQTDSYIFHTNLPPSKRDNNAGCFVDPTQGEAIITDFFIECVNWTDTDSPLSYQFSYQTNFGVVVFHTGWQPNVTTELPVGNHTTNYSLCLQLEVIDFLGDSSVEFITLEVRPPRAPSMEKSKDKLDHLLDSGDVDKAMQMAFALLSAAEETNDTQTDSYTNSLIAKMENVQVGSMQQATLVVGVIALATDSDKGISDDSQEKALNLLGNAANFISSEMSNGSVDSKLVQSIGTSLFSGIGNVLNAASSEAGTDNEDLEEREEQTKGVTQGDQVDSKAAKEKSKKRAKNALNLVSKVGDSLLSTKTVGEKPTVFKTKSLEVLLDRQKSSDMGGKKLGDGPSGVSLPSATLLFSGQGQQSPEAVDSQMLSFNKNPFTWDKSAATVKSSVLDFKLKATGGKDMNISGLPEPVELFIPLSAKEDEPKKSNSSDQNLFLKPSDGTSNLRFHRFSVSSPDVLVTITIKPESGKRVDVFVNYKTKPTPQNNIFSTTLPNLSSCASTTRISSESYNCSSDPYAFTFSSVISGQTGTHYVGIRYIRESTETDPKTRPKRARRSCSPFHRRGKRSCVDVKDPPTTPAPTPRIVIPTYNFSTDVNYSLSISVSGCLYWSESKEKWTGEGCRVGLKTTSKQLHCLCTHLSAFGGDFFVAPNPIDFDKVFAAFGNLAETGNFVVLSTVCAILGLYVIALVIARREDKKDELRVVANVYLNENEGDSKYHISIQTGMWRGNGTSANVGITIFGSDGSTDALSLTDPQLEKIFFSRGSINNFTLCLQESLGTLEKISIWHDNSGRSPSWFLMQVLIVDLATGEKAHFVANRWIAVEKEDGHLELELPVAGKKELSGFKNLFYSRTATSLGDRHLWLSIFTRPPHNPFTRAQRLACCLSILFAAMVTNAMFYNFGTPPGDTVQVGPLKVSLTQIKIGIQSSIVAIPVNVLVVTIFRQLKSRDEPEDGERKGKGCLPRWFVFVAWFICTMATLASAAFIVFYSMMWGAETSNEWLVSVMVSFFQDVIVMQPLKVLLVASILSILIKKPPEQEKVMGESVSGTQGGDVVPLDQQERERARKFRSSLVQIGRKVVEFILFGAFILLMMVVCYGNRGVERYMVTQSIDDLLQSFTNVKNIPSFWKWSTNVLVPKLYDVDWYNGSPFEYKEGFLSNRAAFLVGMPRMRQLRVRSETNCSIMVNEPALARKFSRCLPFYSAEMESLSRYNRPGWDPVQNATIFYSDFELEKECPRPWRYRRPEKLHMRPFGGVMATFVGGGYIADLGYNSYSALKVIKVLENDEWIDDRTAAVFIEFTIFEPSSSLFSAIKLLFERSPTGGSHAMVTIKTLSLYASPDPNSRSLFQICQLLLMIILIVFIFAEIGKLRREKCSYFKQLWNWLELLQICSTICSLVFFFLKESQTSKFVKNLQENPFNTSSTDNIEFLSDLETYLLSFVIFIITIKFLRLIKFNRHVCQVLGTLQRAASKVLSFMTVFVTIILAYTQVGFLVFSSDISAYSSFYSSLRAMLLLLFGGEMHFHALQSTSRYIAPAFLFGYLSSMAMVLLNMFLAILNDSYSEVKNEEHGEAFADAELGAFMVDYMKQKIHTFKDETFELVEATIESVIRFFTNDKEQENESDDLESSSDKAKLASFDSLEDIDSDYDDDDKDTYPLLKLKSLSSVDEHESMSLGDLKETIMQIGREARQSLVSLNIKSAVCRQSLCQQQAPYNFKRAMDWLKEDDDSLRYHGQSSYFSAFGSYLEDIWQKDRRGFQDLTKGRRHKRLENVSKNTHENENLLEAT